MTTPSGTVSYEYNGLGRLKTVRSGPETTTLEWEPGGARLLEPNDGTRLHECRRYDEQGRLNEQVSVLKRIASTLHAAGFKRTVLVAGTNPEDTGGIIAARALFDETETPYFYLQGSRILDAPEIKAMYEGYPGNFGETLVELASLRILGRERPVPLPNWAREPKRGDGGDQPAARQGADRGAVDRTAVLVRDPAVINLRPLFPKLQFHFSTQTCMTSSADVQAAAELGASRVVLARELSLAEIQVCSKVTEIETEVFVQGALCFCISGRCLLSSWAGGRSVAWSTSNRCCRIRLLTSAATATR